MLKVFKDNLVNWFLFLELEYGTLEYVDFFSKGQWNLVIAIRSYDI